MAKGSYTAKIGLDISDVDKKINSLSRELKTIDSDMKTNEKSTELLSQHYAVTAEKAQALAEKLKTLEGARSDVMAAFNAGQIDAEELRAYEREVESTRQALNDCIPVSIDFSKTFEVISEAIKKATELTAAFVSESIQVGKAFESSMSQVAATMAIDKTSEDFAMLSEKAKEAGASTRYTASQAADALNYLALAGYSAEEAVTSLDKVLSLAQAGGMDLARASDMLTDTISALRLDKGDMDELIDKMAVTAQKTNTTVSMLGDALLQVGGTAANVKGGITEINTVLGVLANSGIKASEGGTHLRNILLKMSKPTKNMNALLEKLGMSFYDLDGNMRSIPEIFTEMKDKMDELGLTNQERDSLINKAFNPTDLASVNALLYTTKEDFALLAAEIDNCKNAASTMGDTMNQNLDGALRKMQSAKEAVQVELYEQIQEPLAKLASMAANALQETAEEIKNAQLAKEFNEALQKIADAAEKALPKVMELFKRFAEEVVPRLGEVAEKVIDITTDEVLPKLLDMFEWLMDHGNEVRTAIDMVVAAMAFDKVKKFTDSTFQLVGQFTTLTTQASAAGTAIGGATTSMAGQTAALSGSAGLISKLNLYALAIEGAVAVGLVLKDVIEQQTEKLKEQSKYWNGFTETSNDTVDRYAAIANGENKQSTTELKQQLEKDNEDLKKARDTRLRYEKELEQVENRMRTSETDEDVRRRQELKELIAQENMKVQALENTVFAEQKLYDERKKAEQNAAQSAAMVEKQNEQSAAYGKRYRQEYEDSLIDPAEREAKLLEERAEVFAADQEYQEELWDKKYHWDKKNQEEYWKERRQWLEDNYIDSKEWWGAWNETEAHFSKSDKAAKTVEKNLDDTEKVIKEKLTSFKNDLALAVSEGDKTESQATAELIGYIKANLAPDSELYKTELSSALDKQKSITDKLSAENKKQHEEEKKQREQDEKDHKDDLKKQWSAISKDDLEAQAEFLENLSIADKDLFDAYLEEYAKNVDDFEKAKTKELEDIAKQAKSSAEKIENIYKQQTESITNAVKSGEIITDAKTGRERYIFTNYREKLRELKEYQRNLTRLQGMDIPQDMIKDIFSMDYKTRALYIKELLNMSAGNRQKYINDFMAFRQTAEAVGTQEGNYARGGEIKDIYAEDFAKLKDSAYQYGVDTIDEYVRGMTEEAKKRGLTLDSGYMAKIDSLRENTTAGNYTAVNEVVQKQSEQLGAVMNTVNDVIQKLNNGTINVNIDGKTMFKGYLTDTMNKNINVADKGGVLT